MTSPNFEDAERELQRVEEIERNKRQDRTRAIVEAAERLVTAMRAESRLDSEGAPFASHDAVDIDDLREDVKEPLLDLIRALALPSPQWTRTPPSEDGYYWTRGPALGVQLVELLTSRGERCVFDSTSHTPCNLTAMCELGFEWWPVPVEEPPA